MKHTITSAHAKGRYHWELVFSYDNSENPGTITDKFTLSKKRTVHSREFLSRKLNIDNKFTLNNESSFSLKFDGIGDVGTKTEYSLHFELAEELARTSETSQTIDEESAVERKYEVGPGGKLKLYRLCYVTDGAAQKTDIVSTSPGEEIVVDLNFTCIQRILGLAEVLEVFSDTVPLEDNRMEWLAIRECIIKHSDRPEDVAFQEFVKILGQTTPSIHNTVEWKGIRTTCHELLAAWDTTDNQILFKKLLHRLSSVKPLHTNKAEWDRIRGICGKILVGLRQVF